MVTATLEMLRRQCRVDFVDDDELLLQCGEAAEAEVLTRTGRSSDELTELGEGEWPSPLRQAVMIRAAEFYRDAEGSDKPNALFECLIRPYVKL